MAWLAVDRDGSEWIYGGGRPYRGYETFFFVANIGIGRASVELPKGTIKKLIGRKLKWEDEPVLNRNSYGNL